MLLKIICELPRLLLLAHFDVYGIFLAVVHKINPNDRQLNYFRALFFISAVDVLFGLVGGLKEVGPVSLEKGEIGHYFCSFIRTSSGTCNATASALSVLAVPWRLPFSI